MSCTVPGPGLSVCGRAVLVWPWRRHAPTCRVCVLGDRCSSAWLPCSSPTRCLCSTAARGEPAGLGEHLAPTRRLWGASGGRTNPRRGSRVPPALGGREEPHGRPTAARQAGRRRSAGGLAGLFSATEEALRRLINSTPCVNTSKHRVPKAQARPASHPLRLPRRGDVTVVTAHVCRSARRDRRPDPASQSSQDLLPESVSTCRPSLPCGVSLGSRLTSSSLDPYKSPAGLAVGGCLSSASPPPPPQHRDRALEVQACPVFASDRTVHMGRLRVCNTGTPTTGAQCWVHRGRAPRMLKY